MPVTSGEGEGPMSCLLVENLETRIFGNGLAGELAALKETSQDSNGKLVVLLRIVKGDEETETPGLMKRMVVMEEGVKAYRSDRNALKWIAANSLNVDDILYSPALPGFAGNQQDYR